ncbi:MAG: LytTR family DNA-binding domain-containing protein [Ruminococcus sp.]|nr:LytTR family DNA-binding domain-containing protein [Ruminococcus sp.]
MIKEEFTLRVAICDDSLCERMKLLEAFKEYDPLHPPECYGCGGELLDAAKNDPPIDIAFIDIYLRDENGIEIAKSLSEISPKTEFVFVTTSSDHAFDAFSINALHYLVKPVTVDGIAEAMNRLFKLRRKERQMISLPTANATSTVFLDEISFVQSFGHAKEIVLVNGKTISVWLSIAELEEKLGDSFLKLNRSTIVNMEQIEQMGTESCILRDGTRLEFARREQQTIREAYNNYLFDRLNNQNG